MATRLSPEEFKIVTEFLTNRLEGDDLSQVCEILQRNADIEVVSAADEDDDMPPRGGAMPPRGAMDSNRRDFEKRNGITSRKIRVLTYGDPAPRRR